MSTDSSSRTLWIVGTVLTAALLGLLYASFERVEEEIWVGMRDEARTQPMLAAGRMLRRLGVDAREVAQADWPPTDAPDSNFEDGANPVTALLVWNPPKRLETPRARALTGWVRGGGHLLTTAAPGARLRFVGWVFAGGLFEGDEFAPGLAQMSGTPTASDDGEDDDRSRAWPAMLDAMGEDALLGAAVRDADGPTWSPTSRRALDDSADGDLNCEPRYAADGRVVAMSCEVGRGRLTLVENSDVFLNHRLGRNGHAAALAGLIMEGRPGTVLIDLGLGDARPLLSWAIGRAPIALVLTVVAVALLVWSRARRLGPAHDIAAPSRRALSEHLSAAGQFAWRHDRGQQLAERLEAEVRERAARSIPGWRQMDADAQAAALTAVTSAQSLPANEAERRRLVERALAGPRLAAPSLPGGLRVPIGGGKESAHDYTARVRALNALWQALSSRSPTPPART